MASLPENDLQEFRHFPILPLELTDEIIDWLAVDLPESTALKTATLVCRAWSSRAQSHLFRRMTWTIDFNPRTADEPMATFKASNVKKYVQHITIELSQKPKWNIRAVESLMSGFTNVTSLLLWPCLFFASMTNKLAYALASAFPQTRALQIQRVGFEEDNGLLRLLCAFRSLASFDMVALSSTPMSLYEDGTHDRDIEPLNSLQSVTLSLLHMPASLFHNLLGPGGAANLRHLDLRAVMISDINNILSCGPLFGLESLKVAVTLIANLQLPPLDLHNGVSLTKLELGDNNYHSNDPAAVIDAVAWFSASLATLPSPCAVRTLGLTFYTPSVEEDTLQSLSGVPVLAKLQAFTVSFSIAMELEKWKMDDDELLHADGLLRPVMKHFSPNAEVVIERARYPII